MILNTYFFSPYYICKTFRYISLNTKDPKNGNRYKWAIITQTLILSIAVCTSYRQHKHYFP